MRIHLVTNLFAPDELAGASLYSDMAQYFSEQGHEVRVTCTFSYYPSWKLRPEDVGVSVREETYEGIPIRRVGMYVPKKPTGLTRMLSDASFVASLWRRGRFKGWTPDVIVTAIPMLSQCLVQRFWGGRTPRLIIVQDFVVDAALELGILKLPGLGGFLRGVERYALRSARTLTTISPLMLEKLRAKVGEDRRLVMIPNWIHASLQKEIDRQAALKSPRQDQMLFYSGNLGVKQGLPDFIRDFQRANTGWKLRINGGGAEADRLRQTVSGMPEIQLGGVLEETDYIGALNTCTACLVTQRPGVGANFLPSKLLPALASGTPVLAMCDHTSPLALEVNEGKFGVAIEPGNTTALAEVLASWQADPGRLSEMSKMARLRAKRYSREEILPVFVEELAGLLR